MKNIVMSIVMAAAAAGSAAQGSAEPKNIRISTAETDLVLQVGTNGRLYQVYFGDRLRHEGDLSNLDWRIHAASDGSVSERGWDSSLPYR